MKTKKPVASLRQAQAVSLPNGSQKPVEILAVVMARGGSKGLPGKALRLLLGRPVIEYTFDHVRTSRRVTRIVVSSDDPAILEVARRAGLQVIERPAELATDGARTDDVLRHAVAALGKQGARSKEQEAGSKKQEVRSKKQEARSKKQEATYRPDAVVMLYGNVPIRAGGMIDRCIALLVETGADSVQTVTGVGKMHPYWMFDREADGRIRKHAANNVYRRQDLPELYSPTGAVYVMRTETLMAGAGEQDPHAFLGEDRRGLVVRAEDSVDIDTEKDLFVAEAMLRMGAK